MKHVAHLLAIVVVLYGLPAFAAKNQHRNFPESCDQVWTAAVAVAKTENYRIVTISKEEQLISVIAGGAWAGERVITLSLAPGVETGCTATVQSRFSGLAHSDAPDLLSRVSVELLAQKFDRDSTPFKHYKNCIYGPTPDSKCEEKLHKDLAKSAATQKPEKAGDNWWKNTEVKP